MSVMLTSDTGGLSDRRVSHPNISGHRYVTTRAILLRFPDRIDTDAQGTNVMPKMF